MHSHQQHQVGETQFEKENSQFLGSPLYLSHGATYGYPIKNPIRPSLDLNFIRLSCLTMHASINTILFLKESKHPELLDNLSSMAKSS